MKRQAIFILKSAALLGALSVILGAFGAHKLTEYVAPRAVEVFQKGVYYQFIHALALCILAVCMPVDKNKNILATCTFCAFGGGILFFSGSLYLITFIRSLDGDAILPLWLTLCAPLGGTLFVVGWVLFFFYVRGLRPYTS